MLFIVNGINAQDSLYIKDKTMAPFSRWHDNGNLHQTGFVSILNLYNSATCEYSLVSVCDSTWKLYDNTGKLVQVAHYLNGTKTGVWEYYLDDYIGQVVYSDGYKVRYLELNYQGKLLYMKDFLNSND